MNAQIQDELTGLRAEIAELKELMLKMVAPSLNLSVREEADIMREAVRNGSRKAMVAGRKKINGG